MRLHRERFLLFFFCIFVICSPTVSAQDKGWKQISLEQWKVPTPEFRNPVIASRLSSPLAAIEEKGANVLKASPPEISGITLKSEIKDIKETFRSIRENAERRFDYRAAAVKDPENYPYKRFTSPLDNRKKNEDENPPLTKKGFNWRGALTQSFMFLGVQHGYALIFQKKTRQALKGKFWSDYANSVKSLSGWDDGNRFFTNYIAHPMQGSLTGFIYVQNSPQARRQRFGKSGDYWRSRMKAMLWTTAWSTQFEIGPISQASIGNVGLKGKQTWVDMVITPTVGTALMITEDALDRYLIKSVERRTKNFFIRIFVRMLFNPTRNFANILRFKEPWYRDGGIGR